MGLSGLPSMLMIFSSRMLTIWPQPTAQYGQTLGTSLALAILSLRTSACAARRSVPRLSKPPSAKPPPAEVLRKSRRFTPPTTLDMAGSPGLMTGARHGTLRFRIPRGSVGRYGKHSAVALMKPPHIPAQFSAWFKARADTLGQVGKR